MTEVLDIGESSCDGAALITYIYGEGSEAERAQTAAHLARCAACAGEVAAMGATREQLAAWTPPDRALGFRITQTTTERDGVKVLSFDAAPGRPARWWSQPLPAWAQVAAAVAIFTSGLAIGAARNVATPASPVAAHASGAPVASGTSVARTSVAGTRAVGTSSVSRDELAQLEARLTGEIAQLRTTPAGVAGRSPDDTAVLKRVSDLIAASEQRQQRDLALHMNELTRDVQNNRQLDLINYERRLATAMDFSNRRVNTNTQQLNSVQQRLAQPAAFTPSAPFTP